MGREFQDEDIHQSSVFEESMEREKFQKLPRLHNSRDGAQAATAPQPDGARPAALPGGDPFKADFEWRSQTLENPNCPVEKKTAQYSIALDRIRIRCLTRGTKESILIGLAQLQPTDFDDISTKFPADEQGAVRLEISIGSRLVVSLLLAEFATALRTVYQLVHFYVRYYCIGGNLRQFFGFDVEVPPRIEEFAGDILVSRFKAGLNKKNAAKAYERCVCVGGRHWARPRNPSGHLIDAT